MDKHSHTNSTAVMSMAERIEGLCWSLLDEIDANGKAEVEKGADVEVLLAASEMAKRAPEMRAALVKAVEVIQSWHNLECGKKKASELWDIYWRNSPEMKPIREALTDEERS